MDFFEAMWLTILDISCWRMLLIANDQIPLSFLDNCEIGGEDTDNSYRIAGLT